MHQTPSVNIKTVPVNEFLEKPFGYDESIENFRKGLPSGTKVQKLIKRNPRANLKPDTIYNFQYKKSKVSVYKTQFNQEFLIGGVVVNAEIELVNGIRKGMVKQQFLESFSDLSLQPSDIMVIKHDKSERMFTFYFDSKDRLQRFTFIGGK
jgi:hypothetical protein